MMPGPRDVVITGRGLISPLADSAEDLHRALHAGRGGLRLHPDFAEQGLEPGPVGAIDLDPRAYLSEGNLRPIDRTGQLAIIAAGLALEDSGLGAEARGKLDIGLALGTQYGSVHTITAFDRRALEAGPKYVKPFDFANSVINAAAGQTAIWHGLRGVNSTIAGGPMASLQALGYAADAIRQGRAEIMLAGGAEELCFESAFAYQRSGALAPSNGHGAGGANEDKNLAPSCSTQNKNPAPFCRCRQGFALGEGAALLVLESRVSAEQRGARILGRIHGHGTVFDLSRGRDAETAGRALENAIAVALEESTAGGRPLGSSDLAAVVSGASGSVAGDRHEAMGLGRAVGAGVPITAIKGQLGEALGASGGLQAIALLEALRHRYLPGIAGLEQAEEGMPAGITAEGHELDAEGPPLGLLTALGHDGNTCALVLEGVHEHV